MADPIIIFRLTANEVEEFSPMLRDFEQQFWYPLGNTAKFRMQHQGAYTDFFQAMGDACCFVALRDDQVLGVLSVAIRTLIDSERNQKKIAYVADVKVSRKLHGSSVLYRLARTAILWLQGEVSGAYSVVMDGTSVTPNQYTGRVGVPQFSWFDRVRIFSFSTELDLPEFQSVDIKPWSGKQSPSDPQGKATNLVWLNTDPTLRSNSNPVWLTDSASGACGLLEDTRRAKQLFDKSGLEMRYAHLTFSSYDQPKDLVKLLPTALSRARSLGYTDVFVTVVDEHSQDLEQALEGLTYQEFSASIYGFSLEPDFAKLVYSSEI